MLKKILIGLGVIVVGFLGVVALQPSEFRVTRTATIAAPASAVFAQVNDLRKWEAWSPWARRDPNARMIYEGPASGTGAVFRWAGNHEVGKGSMTITESRPGELIRFRLDFLEPFAGTSTAQFTFEPRGDGTQVTWTMDGRNSFVAKAVCLFMNMDRMIGGDFETGLAGIATAVAAAPRS